MFTIDVASTRRPRAEPKADEEPPASRMPPAAAVADAVETMRQAAASVPAGGAAPPARPRLPEVEIPDSAVGEAVMARLGSALARRLWGSGAAASTSATGA